MNSIKQVTSGLASSLFLAAGFTRLAEKTDPVRNHAIKSNSPLQASGTCVACEFPCAFTPQTGQ
jgi:hypothetical protein